MIVIKGYSNDSRQDVLYNDPATGLGHGASYEYVISTFGWRNSAFRK